MKHWVEALLGGWMDWLDWLDWIQFDGVVRRRSLKNENLTKKKKKKLKTGKRNFQTLKGKKPTLAWISSYPRSIIDRFYISLLGRTTNSPDIS